MSCTDNIINENSNRNYIINAAYHPETGEGSYSGKRTPVHLPDAPISLQYIPEEMENVEIVSLLRHYGSIGEFISKHLGENVTDELTDEVWRRWLMVRIRYDFEFWAV
ncbi:MAG: hypothetical protein RR015_05055, partial [Bacteroidales bacterium]